MLKWEKISELLANVKTNILGKYFWSTLTPTSWVVEKHASIVQNVWIVSEQEDKDSESIFIDLFAVCILSFPCAEWFHVQEQASEQSHQETMFSCSIAED